MAHNSFSLIEDLLFPMNSFFEAIHYEFLPYYEPYRFPIIFSKKENY